ncbi:ABC-type transport auxiliary lipoprotein family protein [Telmatospirillum siberiense]|uniref:ABC transporter n=1 Tax=Telmatospirillum siberiense TaxID=382514 RepID=A0A2N3PUA3_9PROT|nr:ABC-type transport auxiliary lipoprotein family protein [Telmatospirillum siberiense]PKU23983.1 ABC transporter [Telmatospirillum siberiense]
MTRVILALALLLPLGGCFGGGAPSDQFYRLAVPAPVVSPSPILPGVVEVGRFAAEGLTGERALLYSYRDKPDQVARYGYHLWVEAPPVLLQNQLVRLLRETRAASTVVTADLRVPPDILIEGRLRRFEQLVGAAPSVVVEMDLGVIRVRGGGLLLLRNYRVEKPMVGDQPADAVVAFQGAVGEVFGHFLADLAEKTEIR